MTIGNGIILGIIHAFTEFLPLSSSAHMAIIAKLFNINIAGDNRLIFDAFLHFGTAIAAVIVMWQELLDMSFQIQGAFNTGPLANTPRYRLPMARQALLTMVALLPLGCVLLFWDSVNTLYTKHMYLGIMMFLNGCILITAEKFYEGDKDARNLSFLDAVLIGMCQLVSSLPGISRIGVTYTATLVSGTKKSFAFEFIIIMYIPVAFVMGVVNIIKGASLGVEFSAWPAYLSGMAVAIGAGFIAIRVLQMLIQKNKFSLLGYYCWIIGLLYIVLSFIF